MKLKFLTWKGNKVRRRPFIVNSHSVNDYVSARIDVARAGVELVEDEPDYFVIINRADEHVQLPRKRTIGVVCEPTWSPNFTPEYLERRCEYVLSHDVARFRNAVKSQCLCVPWVTLEQTALIPAKRRKLSFVVAPTHHRAERAHYDYRHRLVNDILASELECDIYGDWPGHDRRLKGFLPNKADALLDYEFSVAVENTSEDGYSTEKLVDCFLAGTQPVYRGDPAVHSYFGAEAVTLLDPADPMKTLREIVRGEIPYRRRAVLDARKAYESRLNLVAQIRDLIVKGS